MNLSNVLLGEVPSDDSIKGTPVAILDYKEHTICVYSHNKCGYPLYWAEIVGPLAPTGYRIWSTYHSVATCTANAITGIDDRIKAGGA